MLSKVALENFKPFGTNQVARLSNITLVYGPNSGGKSSLIQALMLLRQSVEGYEPLSSDLITRGEYIDLGSFKALVHKHEVGRELILRLDYDRPAVLRRPLNVPPRDKARRVELRFRRSRVSSSRRMEITELSGIQYSLDDGNALDVRLTKADVAPEQLPPGMRRSSGVRTFQWTDESTRRSFAEYVAEADRSMGSRVDQTQQGMPVGETARFRELLTILADSTVLARGLLPSRINVAAHMGDHPEPRPAAPLSFRASSHLEGLVWEFEDLVRSISYMGPLRSYPARHYLLSGGVKDTVGVRGENTPQMIYRRAKEITASVDRWFVRFDIPYKLNIKQFGDAVTGEIIAMTLKDAWVKVAVAPSDVGFGIGQLLPIIVEGVIARNKILCVEQPEIHLHPRLQAHVADLLIETAGLVPPQERGKGTPRHGNQWIVETHSEALMLRLQRRIRQGRIRSDDVSVLYVEPGGPNGSRIVQLRLGEHGEFKDEWPQGFFEERYKEVFEEKD